MLKPATLPRYAALALILSAATSSTAWAGPPRGPTPSGNPANWVTTEDYPSRALRYEREGTVAFRLMIDPLGTPSSCIVTRTSQSEELDTQTCTLLMLRARFYPAMDDKGRAVEGAYSSSVRWMIPQDEPTEIGPAELVASFVIDTDGKQHDCSIDKLAGPPAFKTAYGMCNPNEHFVVATDKDGKPVARRVRVHMTIQVEDLPLKQ